MEDSEDAFEEVRGALDRMGQMINGMLDLARKPDPGFRIRSDGLHLKGRCSYPECK